jgi:hypothetical protein
MTTDQLTFFRRHKIPFSLVFDATGMDPSQYEPRMRQQEKLFAFGTSPCGKGHRLRSRPGHCIECSTANIAFMMRTYQRSHVYIAASRTGRFVKIGMSSQIEIREGQLKKYRYGGVDDWIIVSSVLCDKAGRVEQNAHQKLAPRQMEALYYWDGQERECYEIFRCGYRTAHQAVAEFLTDDERRRFVSNMRKDAGINYNFD